MVHGTGPSLGAEEKDSKVETAWTLKGNARCLLDIACAAELTFGGAANPILQHEYHRNSLHSHAFTKPIAHAAPAQDVPTLTGLVPLVSSNQRTSEENHIEQQVEYPRAKIPTASTQSILGSTRALTIPRKPIPRFLGRHTDIHRSQLHQSYSFSPITHDRAH